MIHEEMNNWYALAKDFFIPVLAVSFSWFVARYSARQGAKLGAEAAYDLERRKQSEEIRQNKIETLQNTLFIVGMQCNDLCNWWDTIKEHADDDSSWMSLSAFEEMVDNYFIIPLDRLGYLWSDSEESARLLTEFSITQSRYDRARWSINARSEFHREVLQPLVAQIAQMRDPATQDVMFDVKQIPFHVLERAKRSTDNVFNHVATNILDHLQVVERLHTVAKQLFPDARFTRTLPPDGVVTEVQEYIEKLKNH